MDARILPVSAVIPTRHRAVILERTLRSLAAQPAHPAEIIVIDASDDESSRDACARVAESTGLDVEWRAAHTRGAASQRNEGVALATLVWKSSTPEYNETELNRAIRYPVTGLGFSP
jgi:glycosyltransferase involved in cell wall biosynthesis